MWNRGGDYLWRWLEDGAEEWRHLNGDHFGIVPAAKIAEWWPDYAFRDGQWKPR